MPLNHMPRILIVNPYGIGDTLFATPMIRILKQHHPGAHIAVLLGSRTEEIFRLNPNINDIYTYKKDYFRSLPFFQGLKYVLKMLLQIRKQNFDILIDLSNTDEYAFFAKFFWKIPTRIGFNYKNRGRFLNHKIKIPHGFCEKPVADYYTSLLQFLNIDDNQKTNKKLDFTIDDEQTLWLQELYSTHAITQNDITICLLPGGGASWGLNATYRYWPTSYFAKLADLLIEKYHAKILIVGSPSENTLCTQVIEDMHHPAINLSGKTTLQQLAILMKSSHLVIGIESGPLHLAVAIDCHSLPIHGPVDEHVYGPYSSSGRQIPMYHEIACRPCYQNFKMPTCLNRLCLQELTPQIIFEKAIPVIDRQLKNS